MSTAPMQPYMRPVSKRIPCPACRGSRYGIEKRATDLYKCGHINVAVKCVACGGTGRAPEIADRKMASAGD